MASVCKYAVPKGYPDKPIKNEEINGINDGERSGIEISFKYNVDY